MSHHRFDDGASVSAHSSRSSSRSSSASSSRSGSSRKSRSSQVSVSDIKSQHWSIAFMKWTTGVPPGKRMSLRRIKVYETEEDWDDDDGATVYSDASYISYAWVTQRYDDSISEIASRSSSRMAGRLRREKRAPQGRFVAPPSPMPHQQPPPPPPPPIFQQHPQPYPPPFVPPQEPMWDEEPFYDDFEAEPEYFHPQPEFHHPHPFPAPPPPAAPGGGTPAFIDLNGAGGGGIRTYDD